MQHVVEYSDNNLRKKNVRIKGLKEGAERWNLVALLEQVFSRGLGSDCNISQSNICISLLQSKEKEGMKKDSLVGVLDWSKKAAILDALWNKPKISIEGQEFLF